jgi:hypothetical protein
MASPEMSAARLNGGSYQSNRILKESASSHGSATMRSLASLVFDTIYLDKDRAASLHRNGVWIGLSQLVCQGC